MPCLLFFNQQAMIYNFPKHTKGNTFEQREFQVKDSGGTIIDIALYDITMHIRAVKDGALVLDLSTSIEIHDGAAGKFRIKDVVIDIPARRYYYDILFEVGTKKLTWIEGNFTVTQNVTT